MEFKKLLLALCLCGSLLSASPSKESALGEWSGILNVRGMQLTLTLNIEQDAKGDLKAICGCVEQGASNIPIDRIEWNQGTLSFEIKALHASFKGSLNEEASELSGAFTQGPSIPLTFKRGAPEKKIVERPQTPKKPYPYIEEEISYENKDAGVTISGTLTLPRTKKSFPVVLLIAGSGPLDRDETIFSHKPFHVVADHLTRQGIGCLRVDKRGVGKSTGDYSKATIHDFASDVLAGVSYLKNRKGLSPTHIGLIGHSEGGLVAPLAITQSRDVDFAVLMAAPGVQGDIILCEQANTVLRAEGVSEEVIAKDLALRERVFEIIRKESDKNVAEAKLRDAIMSYLAENSFEKEPNAFLLVNEKNAETMIEKINSDWFRTFLLFEPASTLKKVHVPILALGGDRDTQVPASQNLYGIAKALQEGGNTNYKILEIPGLNHVFQTCGTGAVSEYAQIEETFSPVALNAISNWILEKTLTGN